MAASSRGGGCMTLLRRRALIKIIADIFDVDAQAFITAANITDGAQQNAINDLVIGLKVDGIWTKLKAIYPFVGGTAFSHKFNLKDPRDLDIAFRLLFNVGLTHSSTGVLPDGINGFANTFLNPSTDLPSNSMSLGYYSRTNGNTGVDQMDIGTFIISNSFFWLSAQYNSGGFVNRFLARNSSASFLANTANADSKGFYDCSKTSNGTNTFKSHKNGAVQNTHDGAGVNPNSVVYLFAANVGGVSQFRTNRECAFATIGDGLTDADSANLYTLIQAYQTTLGRQV